MRRLAEIYPPLVHQLNLQALIERPLTIFGSNRISKPNSTVRPTDHARINAQTRQIAFNQALRKVSFVQTTVAVSIYTNVLISKSVSTR